MPTKIVKIMQAGECCEVMSGIANGRITVNHPVDHDFLKYPVTTTDSSRECSLCRDDRDSRLIVTVEGLGFSEVFSVFADEEIELVSLTEKVVMEIIDKDSVKTQIAPYYFDFVLKPGRR